MNPVDDDTITALRRLQAISNREEGCVFTSLRGGRIKRERIRREVRRAAVRAGVMDGVDEQRWHRRFTPHHYRTIFTSEIRRMRGAAAAPRQRPSSAA